jgi:hypothetical protein
MANNCPIMVEVYQLPRKMKNPGEIGMESEARLYSWKTANDPPNEKE